MKAHWFRRVAEASGEVQLWEFPSGIGKTQRSFVLRDDTGSETESEIELEQVSHSLFIRRFLKELCSPSLYHKKPELSAQMTMRKLQVGAVAHNSYGCAWCGWAETPQRCHNGVTTRLYRMLRRPRGVSPSSLTTWGPLPRLSTRLPCSGPLSSTSYLATSVQRRPRLSWMRRRRPCAVSSNMRLVARRRRDCAERTWRLGGGRPTFCRCVTHTPTRRLRHLLCARLSGRSC